jgi:hypothetical protein
MKQCNAMNPPGALYCGDCGAPLTLSFRRWSAALNLRERTVDHPHKARMFLFALAGAYLFPSLMFFGHGPWTIIQVALLCSPLLIASMVLILTWPSGSRIMAFCLGLLFEIILVTTAPVLLQRVQEFFSQIFG